MTTGWNDECMVVWVAVVIQVGYFAVAAILAGVVFDALRQILMRVVDEKHEEHPYVGVTLIISGVGAVMLVGWAVPQLQAFATIALILGVVCIVAGFVFEAVRQLFMHYKDEKRERHPYTNAGFVVPGIILVMLFGAVHPLHTDLFIIGAAVLFVAVVYAADEHLW